MMMMNKKGKNSDKTTRT